MKNKNGFTMIELLAVIAILGIISTIAIAGIQGILNRTKVSYLDNQNKMVVLAGKNYYADHRSRLPKVIGPIHKVSLQTLIDLKYIDPVKDAKGNLCISEDGKESKVIVQKVSNEEYKYTAYLSCNGEESGKDDTVAPVVSLTPEKTTATSNIPVNVTLKVVDNIKVLSYRYIIYKDGEEYKDTGYKNYKGTVPIKLKESGVYTIKAYGYDTSGNRGEKIGGEYKIEILKPDCEEINISSSLSSNKWQNKDITVTINSKNNTVESWTIKDTHYDNKTKKTTNSVLVKKTTAKSKKIKLTLNGEHTIKVEGYNSAGGKCTAQLNKDSYKIDKEKPVVKTMTGNPGTWTNKDVYLTATATEEYSGIDHWQYSNDNKKWMSYTNSSKNPFKTPAFSTQQNIYMRAVDKAGNISSKSMSTTLKIDKTKPMKPVLTNPTKGNWVNYNFSVKATTKEEGAGVAYWQYSYDEKNWTTYKDSATSSFTTTPFSKERNQLVYMRVVDKAGNISPTANTRIRIDKTAPVWSIASVTPSNGSIGPTDTLKITFKGTDNNGSVTSSISANNITVKVGNKTVNVKKVLSAASNIANGKQYALTLPGISGDGIVSITISANTLKDAAKNTNTAVTLKTSVKVTSMKVSEGKVRGGNIVLDKTSASSGEQISFSVHPDNNFTYQGATVVCGNKVQEQLNKKTQSFTINSNCKDVKIYPTWEKDVFNVYRPEGDWTGGWIDLKEVGNISAFISSWGVGFVSGRSGAEAQMTTAKSFDIRDYKSLSGRYTVNNCTGNFCAVRIGIQKDTSQWLTEADPSHKITWKPEESKYEEKGFTVDISNIPADNYRITVKMFIDGSRGETTTTYHKLWFVGKTYDYWNRGL